jgi:hypothetical protein
VPTVTPNPTETATASPIDSATPTESATPVPTTAATQTPGSTAGTPTDGGAWFQYSPRDPDANGSVRLVAQPAVAQDAVERYGWDLDGDDTVDRRGRVLELPANTSGETTVTLVVERANGSTASVTRAVPAISSLADEGGASDGPANGIGDDVPVVALLALLLVVLVAVAVAWSQTDR